MTTTPATRERPEAWTRAAWFLLAALAAWALYLGSRPAGRGPIAAWTFGPVALTAAALLVGAVGVGRSLARRPFATGPRVRALFALGGVVAASNLPFPFPTRHEGHPCPVPLAWPVDGTWTVVWGGSDPARNLLARARPDRRYGLDLVLCEDGRTRTGPGDDPADWLAWDRPVRAPAAGEVVRVVDEHEDLAPGVPREGGTPAGNHVVLRVADEAYLFVAGLRRGSVAVAPGDRVAAGDPLGRVGSSTASRFTPEPHLALHVQDTPDPFWGQAVPLRFGAIVVNGRSDPGRLPAGGVGADGALLGDRVAAPPPGAPGSE